MSLSGTSLAVLSASLGGLVGTAFGVGLTWYCSFRGRAAVCAACDKQATTPLLNGNRGQSHVIVESRSKTSDKPIRPLVLLGIIEKSFDTFQEGDLLKLCKSLPPTVLHFMCKSIDAFHAHIATQSFRSPSALCVFYKRDCHFDWNHMARTVRELAGMTKTAKDDNPTAPMFVVVGDDPAPVGDPPARGTIADEWHALVDCYRTRRVFIGVFTANSSAEYEMPVSFSQGLLNVTMSWMVNAL